MRNHAKGGDNQHHPTNCFCIRFSQYKGGIRPAWCFSTELVDISWSHTANENTFFEVYDKHLTISTEGVIMGFDTNRKSGSVMVVGAGIAGMQASLDLAESGYHVYLVEKSAAIGGVMSQLDKTFPTNDCAM